MRKPLRHKRASGLRKRSTGRKGIASREAQARECKPCSILLRPGVKPVSVLDPGGV